MKTKTHHVLAKRVNKHTTDVVYQCGFLFFKGTKNGGSDGAYQPNDPTGTWDFWHEGPTEINEHQALARCAEFGVDEVDIK